MKLKTKFRMLTIGLSIFIFLVIGVFLLSQSEITDLNSKAFDGINSTESTAYLQNLLHEIREALNHETVLGRSYFKDKIEAITQRQARIGRAGRPSAQKNHGKHLL